MITSLSEAKAHAKPHLKHFSKSLFVLVGSDGQIHHGNDLELLEAKFEESYLIKGTKKIKEDEQLQCDNL